MRLFFLAALLAAAIPISASEELSQRIQTLEIQVQELRKEQASSSAPDFQILRDTGQLRTQLGPAASKIYFHPESLWQVGLSSEFFTYQEKYDDRANVLSVA